MARLNSRVIGGYYATPAELIETLISLIDAPTGARIFDPCAADGTALLRLADSLQLTPFANELNEERANLLRQKLAGWQKEKRLKRGITYSLNTDYRQVAFQPEMMSCLFLNPPYDTDDGERLEGRFLKQFTDMLQPEGLLVFIIPLSALASFRLVSYLLAHYNVKRIARSTEGMFERFGQVVVMAYKRPEPVEPSEHIIKRYRQLSDADHPLRQSLHPLTQNNNRFILPEASPPKLNTIKQGMIWQRLTTLADATAEADKVGLWPSAEIRSIFAPNRQAGGDFQPLMPLKMGHLTRMLAGGFIDNQVLLRPDGERMLIRGNARKELATTEKTQVLENGDTQQVRTHRQRPTAAINLLSLSDGFKEVKPKDVGAFMTQYAEQLVNHVAERYRPLYQFDDDDLKQRLGRRGNLYPVQKHIAMAACTSLKHHKEAIIVGEMGTGKTRTALVTAFGSGAKRVLIYCPPHLAKKWAREAKMVWPEIEVTQLKRIGDVDRWMAQDEQARPQVGIMKFTTGSLGSGWRLAYTHWRPYPLAQVAEFEKEPAKYAKELKQWRAFTKRTAKQKGIRQPDTDQTFLSKNDVPYIPETLPKKPPLLRVTNAGSYPHRRALGYTKGRKKNRKKAREYYAPAYQLVRNRDDDGQSQFREHALREQVIRQDENKTYTPPKGGRYPLAEYIKRKYKNRIDLLVVDEVHMLKGGDTDRGYALHRLASSSKMSLALTGTIFGGYSSTLFHILWRTARRVRRKYINQEQNGRRRIGVRRWMNDYGFVEWTEKEKINGETGKTTTNSRVKESNREAPGSMPQMLAHLLPITAFMSLKDLSNALPDYEEIPVPVAPTADILLRAQTFEAQIGEKMRDRLIKGDRSLLGAYLMGSICMPDAPWRDEIVIEPHSKNDEKPRVLAKIDGTPRAEGQLWPKEEAILDLIEKEVKEDGRRCLLLVQQTGTRNIQHVWAELLKERGLSPAILMADADKREAWIEKQYKAGVNVIISNPRKVETGLDLIGYPTIIWSGTEFSIYTIQQASRRAWRLIQKKACKTYFFYYEDTMQETALQLISRKLAAAAKVNGDALDGGLADSDDGGSIEAQLADMAASGQMSSKLDLKAQFKQLAAVDEAAQSFIGVDVSLDHEDEVLVMPPWVKALWPALEAIAHGIAKHKNPYKARQMLNFIGDGRVDELKLYQEMWHTHGNDKADVPTDRQLMVAGFLWRSALIADSVREIRDPIPENRLTRLLGYITAGDGRWATIQEQVDKEAAALMKILDLSCADSVDTDVVHATLDKTDSVEVVVQAKPSEPEPKPVVAQPVPKMKVPVTKPKSPPVKVTPRPVIRAKRKAQPVWQPPQPVNGRYAIMGTKLSYGTLEEWLECVQKLQQYAQAKALSDKKRDEFLAKAMRSLNPKVIHAEKEIDKLDESELVFLKLRYLNLNMFGFLASNFGRAKFNLKHQEKEREKKVVVSAKPKKRLVFGQDRVTV